ncbi:hypothetical protein BVH03_08420 [Pseudomonas sp. PA15(2017)]|uniref:hypothetical protein n=1 Tax=Pseudomonas sp. PA15(2017) TaxID=1932111 RepID=UPI00095DCC00|nr:hypothetical protein [Pseudomonas sp. PA15(2017)]OLU31488.1 hypothetical protein BVH03_08420 [Pseudomonas sp. PA15(2017)]
MRKYLLLVMISFVPMACGAAIVEWWMLINRLGLPVIVEFVLAMLPVAFSAAAAMSWADRRFKGRG